MIPATIDVNDLSNESPISSGTVPQNVGSITDSLHDM
jgi:hypothetical protein